MDAIFSEDRRARPGSPDSKLSKEVSAIAISLLTGGSDRHYAFGLATSLLSQGAALDLIGSNEFNCQELHDKPRLTFLNLRGDLRQDASLPEKVSRVLAYYGRLIRYAANAKPKIFHILWNNKFESFDRTLLMLYYKLLGKKIVLTVHNVNAGKRDFRDTLFNRLTLRIQYRLADHLFVHTEKMKRELGEEFAVPGSRATVIPFGINNAVPNTPLTAANAKKRLGLSGDARTILFFGRVTPYKGLEYLIAAFRQVLARGRDYRLIIAGRPDKCDSYWREMQEDIWKDVQRGRVLLKPDFIPDNEVEVYFKAADALVLPYRQIYQSGILFLGQSFGLPALVADVGSLKDEILEGKTGLVFRPENTSDLARAIEQYFASDLYADLERRRREIEDYATERHSWNVVAKMTMSVYARLLQTPIAAQSMNRDMSGASLNVKASS